MSYGKTGCRVRVLQGHSAIVTDGAHVSEASHSSAFVSLSPDDESEKCRFAGSPEQPVLLANHSKAAQSSVNSLPENNMSVHQGDGRKKCFCGAVACHGWLPFEPLDDDELPERTSRVDFCKA